MFYLACLISLAIWRNKINEMWMLRWLGFWKLQTIGVRLAHTNLELEFRVWGEPQSGTGVGGKEFVPSIFVSIFLNSKLYKFLRSWTLNDFCDGAAAAAVRWWHAANVNRISQHSCCHWLVEMKPSFTASVVQMGKRNSDQMKNRLSCL